MYLGIISISSCVAFFFQCQLLSIELFFKSDVNGKASITRLSSIIAS